MLKSQMAAYQKAFGCQVSMLDFDIAQFIMQAHTQKFFTYASGWAQSPPIVSNPQHFQKVCGFIVEVIEKGYDPISGEWWSLGANFKQRTARQLDLAKFGLMIEAMNGKDLLWIEVKKQFLAFIEINCGLGWRKLASQVAAFAAPVTAMAA